MKEKIVNYVIVDIRKTHQKEPETTISASSEPPVTPSAVTKAPSPVSLSLTPTPKPRTSGVGNSPGSGGGSATAATSGSIPLGTGLKLGGLSGGLQLGGGDSDGLKFGTGGLQLGTGRGGGLQLGRGGRGGGLQLGTGGLQLETGGLQFGGGHGSGLQLGTPQPIQLGTSSSGPSVNQPAKKQEAPAVTASLSSAPVTGGGAQAQQLVQKPTSKSQVFEFSAGGAWSVTVAPDENRSYVRPSGVMNPPIAQAVPQAQPPSQSPQLQQGPSTALPHFKIVNVVVKSSIQ